MPFSQAFFSAIAQANNQWTIEAELGSDPMESAFALALTAGIKGVAMVLDQEVQPLTSDLTKGTLIIICIIMLFSCFALLLFLLLLFCFFVFFFAFLLLRFFVWSQFCFFVPLLFCVSMCFCVSAFLLVKH